jgi:hypothetical protein
MAKVLSFPGAAPVPVDPPKKNTPRTARADAYVVTVAHLDSGEGLPLLIDRESGRPLDLALRWAVLSRRLEAQESTLRGDLSALRYVYAWADSALEGGLEARLERGPLLDDGELLRLRDYLAHPGTDIRPSGGGVPSAGHRAQVALQFLRWAAVPANRNAAGAPPAEFAKYDGMLDAILRPLAKHAGEGRRRIVPVSSSDEERIEHLISPKIDSDGRWLMPLQWHPENPFRPSVRLRVFLMWTIARDAGLRLGELLTLQASSSFAYVDDEHCVIVQRRPDDPSDTRGKRPQVKTESRAVPAGRGAQSALRAYLTSRPPFGRRRGSPYLFTSNRKKPLSISAASRAMDVINEALGTSISWHSLRHAWAEALATELLRQTDPQGDVDAVAARSFIMDHLRALGGWSMQSRMPAYYAQTAIARAARKTLSALQDRRAAKIMNASLLADRLDIPLPWEDEL